MPGPLLLLHKQSLVTQALHDLRAGSADGGDAGSIHDVDLDVAGIVQGCVDAHLDGCLDKVRCCLSVCPRMT